MVWPSPLETRYGTGMRKVDKIEPYTIGSVAQSAPDFDQAIKLAHRCNVGRIVRYAGKAHWVCQFLAPGAFGGFGGLVELERRVRDEKFF